MDLTLPLDNAAIERILPHRFPFLLVDRIIELEPDKRIVGIKNVTLDEWYLSRTPNGDAVMPPTMLTEAVAQVGAILILAKPENRERLPFFAGIERVRYRRAVRPGDVVVIEASVVRLRSRMGMLQGVGRVNGKSVIDGTMTFALSDRKRDRVTVELPPLLITTAPALQSSAAGARFRNWRSEMLETIAVILIVLWLLGIVSGYTMGNFIYVLLVIAIVLFLVRLVSGRRVV